MNRDTVIMLLQQAGYKKENKLWINHNLKISISDHLVEEQAVMLPHESYARAEECFSLMISEFIKVHGEIISVVAINEGRAYLRFKDASYFVDIKRVGVLTQSIPPPTGWVHEFKSEEDFLNFLQLQKEVDSLRLCETALIDNIINKTEQISKMRKALEWYADDNNYYRNDKGEVVPARPAGKMADIAINALRP